MTNVTTYHDPRLDLESLRAEDLYAIASNESAAHKDLALRILVERGSLFALKDDVYADAQKLILDNPIILRKVDPASAVIALKLPGLIEVVADAQRKRELLARVVDQNHAAHVQSIADLGGAVIANRDATDQSLHIAAINLWSYVLKQAWQVAEDAAAQKIEHDKLRTDHERESADAQARLVLLERSLWRKLSDWTKARWSRLRERKADPALAEREDEAAFSERVAEMIRRA
jgi:hypothetical protein